MCRILKTISFFPNGSLEVGVSLSSFLGKRTMALTTVGITVNVEGLVCWEYILVY